MTIFSVSLVLQKRASITAEGMAVHHEPAAIVETFEFICPCVSERVIFVRNLIIVPLVFWHILPVFDVVVISIPRPVFTFIKVIAPRLPIGNPKVHHEGLRLIPQVFNPLGFIFILHRNSSYFFTIK